MDEKRSDRESRNVPHFVDPPDQKYHCNECKVLILDKIWKNQNGLRLCNACMDRYMNDLKAENKNSLHYEGVIIFQMSQISIYCKIQFSFK